MAYQPLTFGVEMEHILSVPCFFKEKSTETTGCLSEDEALTLEVWGSIGEDMRMAGVQFSDGSGSSDLYGEWKFDIDNTIGLTEMDKQVHREAFKTSAAIGTELISRVLPDSPSSFEEIRTVCNILNRRSTIINTTCGLHVHVGRGDAGFQGKECFPLLKNLVLLGVGFEYVLNSFHPPHRKVPTAPWTDLLFGKPFSHSPVLMTKSLPERIECVQRADAFGLLVACGDYNKHYAINMAPLRYSDSKTVEFRAHEGSTDPRIVTRWAKFCVGLVELAERLTSGQLNTLLQRHAQDPSFTAFDLFRLFRADLASDLAEEFADGPWYFDDWDAYIRPRR